MKKFILTTLTILFLFTTFFIFISLNIDSYKIDKLSNYNEFKEYSNELMIRLDSTDADTMLELKEQYYKQLFPSTSNVSVLEVEALDSYIQKGNTYIQNATVKKVIEGDETLLNKEINLTKTGGLIINEEFTDKVYIDTLSCINIMKPNNHYLIFCEKSEISDMLDTNIPEYRFVNAKFALLNIDHDDQTTISDFELINEEPYTMYTQYSEHEFFTASEETLSAFLEIKHEILEQYK